MKDFRLGVFDKNGELKEVSPEFLKPTKVDFDMSDIESHHPTLYLGVDLSMEMELDATNVQNLRKALGESKKNKAYEEALKALGEVKEKAYTAREKAWYAVEATPEFKVYVEACKAVKGTLGCKAYDEAWKAKGKAHKAVMATPEYKAYKEADKVIEIFTNIEEQRRN